MAEAPALELDRIRADETLSSGYSTVPGSCTYYYGFNVNRAPFDDARAVKAFSMAIDRAAITDNITGAGEIRLASSHCRAWWPRRSRPDYPDFA